MAPPPSFALVEWIGDAKPDCWQVIKSTQIEANPDQIEVGKSLDAIWKRGEETAVAKILKLNGRFLNVHNSNNLSNLLCDFMSNSISFSWTSIMLNCGEWNMLSSIKMSTMLSPTTVHSTVYHCFFFRFCSLKAISNDSKGEWFCQALEVASSPQKGICSKKHGGFCDRRRWWKR